MALLRTRRKRGDCVPMPATLWLCHVKEVHIWPLGRVMTAKASGMHWTDCLVILRDDIRIGGLHQSKRVRFDGYMYIAHKGKRVPLCGALAWQVYEMYDHVYGYDAENDKVHNRTLKGY